MRAAGQIDWTRQPDRALDAGSGPFGRWFPGGKLNTAFNCLDRHVLAGHGERTALIWDSAMEGRVERFSYAALLDRVARVAGALAALGVVRGRPGGDLHAHGAGGGHRHAGLRAAGGGALRGVRRLRRARTGQAHRGRAAGGGGGGVLRVGAGACGRIHAAAGRGAGAQPAPAERLPGVAAPGADGSAGAGPRPRFRGGGGGGHPARAGPGGRDGPAVCALHLRHDGQAQGPGAGQWRPCGGARALRADDLRPAARRRVLDRVRRRLGGGPQLHRLRAAARRLHQRDVRGQAGRHARCRRVLAGVRGARGEGAVHRPHRPARHQAAGPGGRSCCRPIRPVEAGGAVWRRRALRPADRGVDRGPARQAGGGPLVADGDGLADHRRVPRHGAVPGFKPGSGGRAVPGLRRAGAGRGGRRGCAGRGGCAVHPPAAAAGLLAHAVGRR